MRPSNPKFKCLVLFCWAAMASSCATVEAPATEQEVITLEHDEIRFMMQKMAAMVFNLEKLVADSPALNDDERQYVVIEQLGEIEKVALKLGAGPSKTNHYVIDNGIDRLVDEIKVAQSAARTDPPQYDPAFHLIDQCKRCHIRR
ncbi:MAG: hypothetical protein ACR2QW_09860 [bacterium]